MCVYIYTSHLAGRNGGGGRPVKGVPTGEGNKHRPGPPVVCSRLDAAAPARVLYERRIRSKSCWQ